MFVLSSSFGTKAGPLTAYPRGCRCRRHRRRPELPDRDVVGLSGVLPRGGCRRHRLRIPAAHRPRGVDRPRPGRARLLARPRTRTPTSRARAGPSRAGAGAAGSAVVTPFTLRSGAEVHFRRAGQLCAARETTCASRARHRVNRASGAARIEAQRVHRHAGERVHSESGDVRGGGGEGDAGHRRRPDGANRPRGTTAPRHARHRNRTGSIERTWRNARE